MSHQPSFREKVCGKLDAASKPGPHHRRPHASIQASDTFIAIDFPQPINSIFVPMLRPNGQQGGIRLQAGFNQEERGTGCSTEDAGSCPRENIDS
jgi:hypothetical protein